MRAPRPVVESVDQDTSLVGGAPVLQVEEMSKTYRTRHGELLEALKTVSFDLRPGEFVSLLGPSGCGKTTLLKICAGLVIPSSGRVTFRGRPGAVPPGTFGMVFQNPALLPWRSVLDNVLFPADIRRLEKEHSRNRAQHLLQLMRLEDMDGKFPGELSGGMQQRVSIARALLHDPEILFMDEPFGALDAMTREEMGFLLQQVHLDQRKTILFVTHSIREAILLSDRVVVFSHRPAELILDLDVPFARPRTMDEALSPEFTGMEAQVRRALNPGSGGEGGGR